MVGRLAVRGGTVDWRMIPAGAKWCILRAMTGPAKTAESSRKTGEKAERLAAALRENLKRRKAQARAKERVASRPGQGRPVEPAGPLV